MSPPLPSSSLCPRCLEAVPERGPCGGCGLAFSRVGAMLDVIGDHQREERAAEVESFYGESPFPGYGPHDDAGILLERARGAPFLAALDAAVPPEGHVLDCGCGTAQLAAFLAISGPRRTVFGIDGCLASLAHAEEFRARAALGNLQLVRADLFDLPVAPGSFEVVICRGVVHHTPDPEAALAAVARCVRPGGTLVLGFYETAARLFHRARRCIGRVRGRPVAALDPILRRPDVDPEKKRIWIDDQYRHPLEHILPLPRVLAWLERLGFQWVRTVPPLPDRRGAGMFAATRRPRTPELAGLRLGWALRGWRDQDAGLICVVARRQSRS